MKSGEVLLADIAGGRSITSSEMRELNPALSLLRRVALFAELDELSAKLGKSSLLGRVRSAIKLHKPRNCFEQRYDHYLLECLDNRCGRAPNEPIGGQCTLSAERAP